MSALDKIDTIAIILFENRSFDHVLGHLSLNAYGGWQEVEGLVDPITSPRYVNVDETGRPYYPFEMADGLLPADPPHERPEVAIQLDPSPVTGQLRMDGFVKAYFQTSQVGQTTKPPVMGFMTPHDVPVSSFLAKNYSVCDHWFAPLPTSTVPNRLMALTGESRIDQGGGPVFGAFPPRGDLVLDWLTLNRVPWRVYHRAVSFFTLLGRFGEVLEDTFRLEDHLAADWKDDPDFPKVIFIEPSYNCAPHVGSDHPNCNHPPLAIGFGEQYLREVYTSLSQGNADRWSRTLLVVTYDEHGGFFDHVTPPLVPYGPPPTATYAPFESMGVRVPALAISPLIAPRTVCKARLDHTSLLQLLAEKFTPGAPYSPEVQARAKAGNIASASVVLNLSDPRPGPAPSIPDFPIVAQALLTRGEAAPVTPPNAAAFNGATEEMIRKHPAEVRARRPDLLKWQITKRGP